ncbi:hypothetical protein [Paenibacillus sp. 102]|uniref:hypothetical protein n=1 Tax=Paenibacillus sp. 102 TaxID=3120823 RepID=UPI0031BAC879
MEISFLLSINKIVTFTIKMFKNVSHVISLKGQIVEDQLEDDENILFEWEVLHLN